MILKPSLIAPIHGGNDFSSECGKWRNISTDENDEETIWIHEFPKSRCRHNLIDNGTFAVTFYSHSWGEGLKC